MNNTQAEIISDNTPDLKITPMNGILNKAKKVKIDEYYTLYETVEKEMRLYKDVFNNAVVCCNCDIPETSNFWKYFVDNFKRLNLKSVIATYMDKNNPVYKYVYNGEYTEKYPMKSDGDLLSDECIDILKSSDIIITNPPFTVFRQLLLTLIKYNKKFDIMGNLNSVTYKDVFPLLKRGKVWFGDSIHTGGVVFQIPDNYKEYSDNVFTEDNKYYINLTAKRWYTNIDYPERFKDKSFGISYKENFYDKYSDCDALFIGRVEDIPNDYDGVMAVPVNFIDIWNPNKYELLNCSAYADKEYYGINPGRVNGKKKFARIFIRKINQ